MAAVAELIRTEADGKISFGNHLLQEKSKKEGFEAGVLISFAWSVASSVVCIRCRRTAAAASSITSIALSGSFRSLI